MFGKKIKSFLVILFLLFVFIDAANIVDLFSYTEVIHYEEGNPDSSNYVDSGVTAYRFVADGFHNSSSKTNVSSHAKKKSSLHKFLIYDQDSPSVIHDIQIEEESIGRVDPTDFTIPSDQTVSRAIYIENCSLQI